MPAVFIFTKRINMNKITYTGNGETTNFSFTFPFFLKSDIKVKKNNEIINTGYEITTVSQGANADIPFSGGTVIFDSAPASTDTITIYRSLNLSRITDYQPTVPIDTVALNQDFSFIIELLKDVHEQIDILTENYDSIASLPNLEQVQNDISALKNANNFTTNGKNKIASWGFPSGDITELDFLEKTAGAHQYIPANNGFLSAMFTPDVNGTVEIYNVNGKTIYNQDVTEGRKTTVLMPVSKNQALNLIVPTLRTIHFQRLIVCA